MTAIVMKFGGASVADRDRLRAVARKIVAATQPVVVVVSARQGHTDRLISDMREVTPAAPPAALDVLKAVGEMHSAALLAAAVTEAGRPAEVVPPWLVIETNAAFGDAAIESVHTLPLSERLGRHRVPIVPGFIGATADGRLTTLGRGGSDYTAVAVGVALNAKRVELYKAEVDGVYHADPNKHPGARRYATLSHDEALRLAQSGAKVLQEKAARLALQWHLPVVVRPTFAAGPGTRIVTPQRNAVRELVGA